MTEPIYGASGLNVRTTREGSSYIAAACGSKFEAIHICALLNENPLPEDKPKRFTVQTRPSADPSWVGVHDAEWGGAPIASFSTSHCPDPWTIAQDLCDRLNADG